MKRSLRSMAVGGALALGGFGVVVVQAPTMVGAESVTTRFCTANVTPSTGVTVSIANDGDCVAAFRSSTAVTWTRPSGVTSFELLVVAAGGGGGAHPFFNPGGGGGGGVVHVPSLTLTEASYDVTAGAGGIGNAGECGPNPYFSGQDGGNSYFGPTGGAFLVFAFGGGGGGGACDVGRSGGSGGGAHCWGGKTSVTQAIVDTSITNATVYGNEGGASFDCRNGSGGGGGAMTPGQDGTETKAGDGGEGVALDVLGTGTPVVYASGGGGAGALVVGGPAITPGVGGTNGGDAKPDDGPVTADNNGVDGTGSGGGGQMCPTALPCPAGKGGDGVVIIRWASGYDSPNPTTPQTTVPATTVAPDLATTTATSGRRKTTTRTPTQPTSTATTVPTSVANPPETIPASDAPPAAPTLKPGEAQVLVDGEATTMTITRRDDSLVLSFGDYTSTLAAITPGGTRRPLDLEGNISFENGDALSMSATGFAGESDIDVWMFSTPARLGTVTTNAAGAAESLFDLVNKPKSGNHRIVVSGTSPDGKKIVMVVGVVVAATPSAMSTASKLLIALPLIGAVFLALILPTRRRRRLDVRIR